MHVLYKEDQISISKFDSILKKGSPHQMVHGKLVLDDASEIPLAGNNSPPSKYDGRNFESGHSV